MVGKVASIPIGASGAMSDKLIEAVAKALFDTIHREHRGDAWPTTRDDVRDGWRKQARSALSAIEASGYAVVPKEPTEKMISSARNHIYDLGLTSSDRVTRIYAAMLAARPKVTP